GLREMVDHKPLALEPAYKLRGDSQMFRIDKDVISEVEFADGRDAAAKRGFQQKPVVRLALDDVPESHQLGMSAELIDLRADVVGLQVDPSNDSNDKGMSLGELEQPPRL